MNDMFLQMIGDWMENVKIFFHDTPFQGAGVHQVFQEQISNRMEYVHNPC